MGTFYIILTRWFLMGNRAQEFERWLALRREVVHCLPRVSLGSAPISGEDLLAVKDQADREMYRCKKARKAAAAAMERAESGRP